MRSLILLASTLLLTGCYIDTGGSSDRFQEDFHYSWDLQPGGRILVETFNGRVEITGWDQNKVEVSGTKYGSTEHLRDAVRIETHNSPNLIEVRTIRPSVTQGGSGARFVIHVPRSAVVERVTTSNGSIELDHVATATHLKSSNGQIRVTESAGDLDARTSNGGIELDRFNGNVQLRTSNGHIKAESVNGRVDAETTNSWVNVRLSDAPHAPIRLVSTNGNIELAMSAAPKDDIRAETRNGGITLRLPANATARLNAETTNSSVSSEFDLNGRLGEESHRGRLTGNIGNGGPSIDLTTRNGHIRILKSPGA